MASMASIVTPNQFWRYKDMWQNSLRNVVFAVVLVEFLATHKMASIESVSEQLGSKYLLIPSIRGITGCLFFFGVQ